MAVRHYIEEAKCADAVGGYAQLRQLLKQAGAQSASVDPVRLESARCGATAEVRTAIGHDWNVDAFDALWFNAAINGHPAPATPMDDTDKVSIENHYKAIFCYFAWGEGTAWQSIPEEVVKRKDAAIVALKEMGKRLSGWGTTRQPGTRRHFAVKQPLTVGHWPQGGHRSRFGWQS